MEDTNPRIIVSPVHRIPSEVTVEIFTQCLAEAEFPRPSVRSAPLQLSHVCRTWRSLTITTPRLWCKIHLGARKFDGPRFDEDGAQLDAMALEFWIERAGSHLISADIRYPNWSRTTVPNYLEDLEDIPPVFRVIVRNRTSWKGLRISMPEVHLALACYVTQQNAPYLETFEVDDTYIPTVGYVKSKIKIFLEECLPETLLTLSVRGAMNYRSAKPPSFPRLRSLSVQHTYIEDCLRLVKDCPVLEDLTLHFYDMIRIEIPFKAESIVLPRLQNFRLAHTANGEDPRWPRPFGAEFGELLDRFKLPNLRGFYLWMTIRRSRRDIGHDTWDYLSRLIKRSNCSLNRLEIISPHIETSTILECLHLSPDLRYLGILANEDLEGKVVQLLPGLESLRIFNSWLSRD